MSLNSRERSVLCTWETEGGYVASTPTQPQVPIQNEALPPAQRRALETELALARLGASLAHALGTPLQVISGRAALAEGSVDVEEAHKHVAIIVRKCREMSEFLRVAVANLRAPDTDLLPVDVGCLVRETLERAIGNTPRTEVPRGRPIRIEWVATVSTVWNGRVRVLPLVEVLTSLFETTLRRHTDGPLTVSMSRADCTPDASTLEIACDWCGAPLSAALQGHLNDPWQVYANGSERCETLEFLAPYEAARQNGASLSFPGTNHFRLAWPVENCEPEAAQSAEADTKR